HGDSGRTEGRRREGGLRRGGASERHHHDNGRPFQRHLARSFEGQSGHLTLWIDPRPRRSASLVSTNVESSRKSIASPCNSSPVTLQTGRPLGCRRPPAPGTNV